ncbi:MAG: phosphoadenylyl-sulfate reductase [Verrucomicrobiaceae bacterium]|nr:phosphoadenylyl-sulfate reductase [Verrucomicrobiaceae bacterium]
MNAPLGQETSLAGRISANWTTLSAAERIRSIAATQSDGLIATTSFGAQSAIMLHLLKENAPEIPIIFIDTGYLFPETYQFAAQLIKTWNLDIRTYHPTYSSARLEALYGKLWEQGDKGAEKYGVITKVEPMDRALKDLGATSWLSGLRRSQSSFRAGRHYAEQQKATLKLYPILDWSDGEAADYIKEHDLPKHPLVRQGYVSIGDWHSTKPMTEGMTAEDTRFDGAKRECGLHLPSEQQDFQI